MDMNTPEDNALKMTGILAGLAGSGYWLFPKLLTKKFGVTLLLGSRFLGQSLVSLAIFLGILWREADVPTQRVTLFCCIVLAALAGITSVNAYDAASIDMTMLYTAMLCFVFFLIVFLVIMYASDSIAKATLLYTSGLSGVLGVGSLVAGRRLLRSLEMDTEFVAVLNGEVEFTLALVAGIIILTEPRTKRAALVGQIAWYAIFCVSSAQYWIEGDSTHLMLFLVNTGGLFYCLRALNSTPEKDLYKSE